jgi:PAS domain S-box-containing protein
MGPIMESAMRSRGFLWKLLLLAIVDAAALWGLGKAILVQKNSAEAWINLIADLRDPSPFRVALRAHLDKIELTVRGYLSTRDGSLLKQVAGIEQDFERLVPDFQRQDPRLFPPAASSEILQTYRVLKDSVDWALRTTSQRAERWTAADGVFSQMLYLVENRLKPLSREGTPSATARRDALLNFENHLRARQQAFTQSWAEPELAAPSLDSEFEARGTTFLDLYERVLDNPRERALVRRLRAWWEDIGSPIHESVSLAADQTQALERMNADRDRVRGVLEARLPAMRREDLETKKQGMMRALRGHIALGGLLVLAGIVLLAGSALISYRWAHPRPAAAGKAAHPEEKVPEEPTLRIDLNGTIIDWSQTGQHLYGYSAWEIKGQSVAKLFASESEIRRLTEQIAATKQAHFETIHLTKEGTAFPVRIDFRQLSDEAGRSAGIGLICHRR